MTGLTLERAFTIFQILPILCCLTVWLGGIASLQHQCYSEGWDSPGGPVADYKYILGVRAYSDRSCSTFLRYQWGVWAYSLITYSLIILVHTTQHFRYLKAGVYAVTVAVLGNSALSMNYYIDLARRDDASTSTAAAAMSAAVGEALCFSFAFLGIICGSQVAYSRNVAFSPVGIESTKRRLLSIVSKRVDDWMDGRDKFKSYRWCRLSYFGFMGLASAGCISLWAGAAIMQDACNADNSIGGIRLPWYPYPEGVKTVDCRVLLGFVWFNAILQLLTLMLLVAMTLLRDQLARFKASIWALIVSSMVYSVGTCAYFSDWTTDATRQFHHGAQAALAGNIIYSAAAYLVLLSGSFYIYTSYAVGNVTKAQRSSGNESEAKRIWLLKTTFMCLQIGAWLSEILCLVGLSLYQYTLNNDASNALVGSNTISPSTRLRFNWFVAAWQLVILVLFTIVWRHDHALRQFKSAIWLAAIFAVSVNMITCTNLYPQFQFLDGELQKRIQITFAGFVAWDCFMYTSMFVGSAWTWEQRNNTPPGDDVKDEGDEK